MAKTEILETEGQPLTDQRNRAMLRRAKKDPLSKKLLIFYPFFYWIFLGYMIYLSGQEATQNGLGEPSAQCQTLLKNQLKSAFRTETFSELTDLQEYLALAYYQIFDPFWAFFILQYFYLLTWIAICIFVMVIYMNDSASVIITALAVGREGLKNFLHKFFKSSLPWALCFLGPALSPCYYIYFFYAKNAKTGCLEINVTEAQGIIIVFILAFYVIIWVWLYFLISVLLYCKERRRLRLVQDQQGKPDRAVQLNTVLQENVAKMSSVSGLEKITIKDEWEIQEDIEKGQIIVKDIKMGTTMKKNNEEVNKALVDLQGDFNEQFYDEKIKTIMILYKKHVNKENDAKDCKAAMCACFYLFFFFFHVIVMAVLLVASWICWLILIIFVKGAMNTFVLAMVFFAPLALSFFIMLVKQVEEHGFKSFFSKCTFTCKKLTPEEKAKRDAEKLRKKQEKEARNKEKQAQKDADKKKKQELDQQKKLAKEQANKEKDAAKKAEKQKQDAAKKAQKEKQDALNKQKLDQEAEKKKLAQQKKAVAPSKEAKKETKPADTNKEDTKQKQKELDEQKKRDKEEEERLKKEQQEEEKKKKAELAKQKKEEALEKKRKAAELKRGQRMDVGDVDRSEGGPLKIGEQVETKFKKKRKGK